MTIPLFILDLLERIFADVIAILIILLLSYMFYFLGIYRKRRSILNFFGIKKGGNEITVVCSRISVNLDDYKYINTPRVDNYGIGVNFLEYKAIEKIRKAISGKYLVYTAKDIREFFRGEIFSLVSISPDEQVAKDPSEIANLSIDQLFPNDMVIIGSSVNNSLVGYLEEEERKKVYAIRCTYNCFHEEIMCFKDINNKILKPGRMPLLDKNQKPVKDKKHLVLSPESSEGAVIQRIYLDRKSIIICEGFSANATLNAVYFLVDNWDKRKYRKYFPKDREFATYIAWSGLRREEMQMSKKDPVIYSLDLRPL